VKVAVVGAGAMGCLYGAALHRGGAEVTLVDVNADHIAAINASGLQLDTRAGVEEIPLSACRPEELVSPREGGGLRLQAEPRTAVGPRLRGDSQT
jgi:2-dehydropantoate 2-reductase